LRFLVVICIVMALTVVFASDKSPLVFSSPPASGDWIVTGTEIYHDEVIVLNGNLFVRPTGNLTFRNVTLKMNCTYEGQYHIAVESDLGSGGKFYVLEGSIITSAEPDKRIGQFLVEPHTTFRMNQSKLLGSDRLAIMSGDAVVADSLISHNRGGISIQSDGVVVRNNNISLNDDEGISVHFCSPTIYNNTITSNYGSGISIHWNESCPIIQDNIISFNNGTGIVTHAGNATVYNNIVKFNEHSGIGVYGGSPAIFNNTIKLNKGQGILCGGGNCTPIIQDNVISLNMYAGVRSDVNSSPTIEGNNITSNAGGGGIVLQNCTGIIRGNMIMNNTLGISSSYSNPLIQGNIITSNWDAGIHCADNSLPEVHWNDIYGNDIYGIGIGIENDDLSVSVNATYNYWGNGPCTNGEVLATPWLTESIVFPKITNPLSGGTVSSTVTVSTIVYARSGVGRVEFYIDDYLDYIDYDASFEWDWNTTQYTETEHEITAKAYDAFGLKTSTSITVFVDNTAPQVLIKEPVPDNIYSGTADISVNATDNRGLANVYVKVDNTEWLVMTYNSTDLLWKYDLNTATLSDGQHTLMFLALDKASNPTTTSTTLSIDNTPPTLTIQTPQNGTTVGMTLIVDVQASDASGISRIEFFLQNVLVHSVTDTPYQWSWDTTQYPNGEYTITVRAYDTSGKAQTSETTVTVRNAESPWWQTHLWTIIEVLVAVGGLMLGILTYLASRSKKKKESYNVPD
jgi:parallel beta-helix repeat protein